MKYDIIGLSEVRRIGNNIIEDESHIFCHTGETQGHHGVGFLINKNLKNNILSYTGLSERVCLLHLKFDKEEFSIIQAYAPTKEASNDEIDSFYATLREAQKLAKRKCILMGDFNAKIGQRKRGEDMVLGPYCYGIRNTRGELFLQYAMENKLAIINTLFKKNPKKLWTWLSPNGKEKNQIDFISTNIPKRFTNIEVLKNKVFSSDHNMVRGTFTLKQQKKSRATFSNAPKSLEEPSNKLVFLKNLEQKVKQLKTHTNEDIEPYYERLETTILQSLNSVVPKSNTKQSFISEDTRNLIKCRSDLQKSGPLSAKQKKDLSMLYKATNKNLRKDYVNHRLEIMNKHLTESGSLKKGNKQLNTSKIWIPHLNPGSNYSQPNKVQTRSEIVNLATNFYRELYDPSEARNRVDTRSSCIETEPEKETGTPLEPKLFEESEIIRNIEKLKSGKSPGPDNITNEAIKNGKMLLAHPLTTLFNKILQEKRVPKKWTESRIILLYKKGNPSDVGNYRPISLLSSLYKLFASCLLKRIEPAIEEHQPIEQAGFRQGFCTTDHIHTLTQIIEKYVEFNRTLYLAFVDYKKAFDSVSHASIWKALSDQSVPNSYIQILKNIYDNSTSRVKLDQLGPAISIRRGVKQGDPLSPKLFIAVLQSIMKNLNWERKGIRIKDRYLSNLRFADDIVIFSESRKQLEEMINELMTVSNSIGLEMNASKTKILTNSAQTPVTVSGTKLEYVESYIYLGKEISFKRSRNEDEVNRRICTSWQKFWCHKEVLKSKLPLKQKKKVMDSCILPCLTYACQTWTLNKTVRNKIQTCQRAMERSILNLKLNDRQRNEDIRHRTKVIDALQHTHRLKWKWAGHVARLSDQRWTKLSTTWHGPTGTRSVGRPQERWKDEISKLAGENWIDKAQQRGNWIQKEEAFTQRGVLN